MRPAMARRFLLLVSSATASLILAAAGEASAEETAVFCSESNVTCETAPIAFSKEIVLPIQAGFDTGWVPQGSPLQVHLFAQLYANSRVDLAGYLETTWPDALTVAAYPQPGAGYMGIHYGVEIGAEAMVSVTVLGQTYTWQGDIPGVPQFDFQVEEAGTFDPWAFDGVSIDGSTMEATLFQVSATDFIGVNIPGLDGGFELNTYIELKATYQTDAIEVVRNPGEAPLEGGDITSMDLVTFDTYAGEPGVDYAARPVGHIVYEGTLHLIPAFYIETIGPDFSIPIADIPIPFSFSQDEWTFDWAEVHVPLPDIEIGTEGPDVDPELVSVVDLGEVAIGDMKSSTVAFSNVGEQRLIGTPAFTPTTPEEMPMFNVAAALFDVQPGAEGTVQVTFSATEPGEFEDELVLASNDPDEPSRRILFKARVPQVDIPSDDDDDDGDDGPQGDFFAQGGGCSCDGPGAAGTQTGAGIFLVLLALAASRRGGRQDA